MKRRSRFVFGTFFGDVNQSEKFPEIKPPLFLPTLDWTSIFAFVLLMKYNLA
jgi:hypothetical protein